MTMNINNFCPLDEYIAWIHEDGQDWFFAKNVCRALQIEGGPAALKRHLPERSRIEITPAYARSGDDPELLVSEDAFYEQVLVSSVPAAERFKSWVLTVVLPTMLKDGIYIPGEEHRYPTPDCKHEDLSVWKDESIWADESRHWELTMWWDWVYHVLEKLRCAEVGILDPYVLMDEPQSVRDAVFRKMINKKVERRARLQPAVA